MTTFRLSEAARTLLARLAEHHGIAQTAVVEMAVRQMARRDLPDDPETTAKKKK
jgi:hypothetical protein